MFGGGSLSVDPSGTALKMPVTYLEGTPFDDYRIPGVILFVVLGLGSVLALYGVLMRPPWAWAERLNPFRSVHWAWTCSLAVSLAAMIWIAVQVAMIGYASFLQPLYGGLGLAMLAVTLLPGVRQHLRREGGRTRTLSRGGQREGPEGFERA